MLNARIAGLLLLTFGLATAGGVAAYNNQQRQVPIIFSDSEVLTTVWGNYKKTILEPNTYRALDRQRGAITTSEAEGYTMLRAVWMDDQTTFDQSWQWTKDNLGRPTDHLSSWLFGQRSDGSYGVITEQGGYNSAADGDTDIALALILAHGRWNRAEYLTTAKAIVGDIWKFDVVQMSGKPVLAADDLERNSKTNILVNPSYFSPAAYRLFAKLDPAHNWEELASNSYAILSASAAAPLGSTRPGILPPNWVVMSKGDGSLKASDNPQLPSGYGYDALRIPWRVALDYVWFESSEAYDYLHTLRFFTGEWTSQKKLASVYRHDGTVSDANESPAMYGAAIGYFLVADHEHFKEVYDTKLATLYSTDKDSWAQPDLMGYYNDNLAWFGIALATGQLPNLSRL
jgi:endo-1,4-beta-D-glucanase Y